MKTPTIRLPDPLAAEIEAESRIRKISKSDVVRERLRPVRRPRGRSPLHAIADLDPVLKLLQKYADVPMSLIRGLPTLSHRG